MNISCNDHPVQHYWDSWYDPDNHPNNLKFKEKMFLITSLRFFFFYYFNEEKIWLHSQWCFLLQCSDVNLDSKSSMLDCETPASDPYLGPFCLITTFEGSVWEIGKYISSFIDIRLSFPDIGNGSKNQVSVRLLSSNEVFKAVTTEIW